MLGLGAKVSHEVSYSLKYNIEVTSHSGVMSVTTSDPISVTSANNDGDKKRNVNLSREVADPSCDLQILVEMEKEKEALSTCHVVHTKRGRDKTAVSATFIPLAPLAPLAEPSTICSTKKEVIMLVDCSGSMNGDPIQHAREAAVFFVRDLPVGEDVLFNIVCFGRGNKSMYQTSRSYDSSSEASAIEWVHRNIQ